ncbi:MAG: hypothetical protein MK086_14280 [Flavobacteriales bacterium]|nr:hypothetical protein [Flavobacteriales bacterium]
MTKEREIIELDGEHKACKNCGQFFVTKVWNKIYCKRSCGYEYRKKKRKKAERRENRWNKIDYPRLTFILSFLGFVGAIGFYLGVLKELYSPASDKQKIELLQTENAKLQDTIYYLSKEKEADE